MFRTIVKARRGSNPLAFGKQQFSTAPDAPLARLKGSLKQLPKQADMVQSLRELRTSPIYGELMNWTKKQYEVIPKSGDVHDDPRVRNVAGGHALCYALNSVVHLANGYDLNLTDRIAATDNDPEAAERAFLSQIRPAHAEALVKAFRESWRANSELRQAAILSALQPGVAEKLGLTITERHTRLAQAWGTISASQQLTLGELLALVDYVNSATGTFNAVNGTALAAAYYGEPVLQKMTATLSATLDSAIQKLCRHPYFGRQEITTYKGILLSDEAGVFRKAMLNAAVGSGKLIPFPNVLSATANPNKSYAATKDSLGYSIELQITMRTAFYADPFHDTLTMGEDEVIGPRGQKFIVTEKLATEVFSERRERFEWIDRYVLKPKN